MKLLQQKLQEIRSREFKKPALMTHVVLGYPSLKESIEIVRIMADSGASMIELQIPFSDPIGDGPTIMAANSHALEQGVRVRDCMRAMETLASKLSGRKGIPLLFMSYINPLVNYRGGLEKFCTDAASAGAQGLIVPDIPPEEKRERFWSTARNAGLLAVPLVTPVSSAHRLKQISRVVDPDGFIYCVSTTATTGAQRALPTDIRSYLARMRKRFRVPLALGFGISTPKQVRSLRGYADIAIVGSATIDLIRRTDRAERRRKFGRFIAQLAGQ